MSKLSYPRYQHRSGWNALLPPRANTQSLSTHLNVDVAVIGAGYTGIAAAKRWRELAPDDAIAIIDATVIGEGTPGRNSGFLLEIALANDARAEQMQRMMKCNALIGTTMEKIAAAVKASNIDCALRRTGTYRAAAGGPGKKALQQYRSFLHAAGLPYEMLDRADLKQRLGTGFYQEGLYSPHCYLAQPAALIQALAQQLPPTIQLYENTPATALTRTANRWLIETPDGTIKACNVVLANNGFSKMPGVGKSRLLTIYTYAAITRVLDQGVLDSLGSEKNWGLLPTHRLGSTLRRTEDGRLMIRSRYGYETETNNRLVAKAFMQSLQQRFPQLREPEFEHVWGGAIGFTINGGPIWGEVQPGLFVSAGCNGGGVVKGTLFGELLADLANKRKVPDVTGLFGSASWMPPEPFRALGFQLISAVEGYRGRAEA